MTKSWRNLDRPVEDVLGDAIAEIVLFRIATQIDEGQHGDRGPGRTLGGGRFGNCGWALELTGHADDAIDTHRSVQVLELPLAQILELHLDLVADVIDHGLGKTDAARHGHSLQARSDVDAVAVKIAAFDDHIAKIDSDAQQDAPISRYAGVGLFHPPLKVHRALHRINGAAELHKHAVTHQFDNASVVLGKKRGKDVSSSGFERLERAGLVPLHEPAVAGHIGGEDGCEATSHAGASLGASLAQRHARRSSGSPN